MKETFALLAKTDFPAIRRSTLQTLQVNLGYLCNQQCLHCHVDASPRRKEIMSRQTIDAVLDFMQQHGISQLDLTGGAPEMNPHFQYLVSAARKQGVSVIDRCNLSVLLEPEYEGTAEFLARQQVEIVASLPCYLEENVDAQRGKGVFERSIRALRLLNRLGYARRPELQLNLVYNPQGASLPPEQGALEAAYREKLEQTFAIHFNHLYTITNMPIKRFGSTLISRGQFDEYMALLKSSYNADSLPAVMCRSTLSVDWRGYVYDCDFNQMLDLPAGLARGRKHLSELQADEFNSGRIAVMDHCYGCTAGMGSSCGGALV